MAFLRGDEHGLTTAGPVQQRADRYISLARSDETAKTLVDTSPIACRVSLPRISHDKRARQLERLAEPTLPKIDIQTKTEGGATSWDTTATATTTTTGSLPGQDEQYKAQDAAAAAAALSAEDTFETREFELTIVPVRDYDHGVAATKAIEYSRWPAGFEADRSFAAAVLQETLPSTLAGKGLSRWHVNPALGTPRDSMSQRLERKQQVPGQMAAEAARTSRGSD